MLRIGIIGHRHLADVQTISFVKERCRQFLAAARNQEPEVKALSAIAEGADSLFAEAALELGIPLEIVRPFVEYAADFETPLARERYERLRAAARSERKLDHLARSDNAYRAAMEWIVNHSDVLVIAWNGLPAAGPGGTGTAVEKVIHLKRSWLHLDVNNLTVEFHQAEQEKND